MRNTLVVLSLDECMFAAYIMLSLSAPCLCLQSAFVCMHLLYDL